MTPREDNLAQILKSACDGIKQGMTPDESAKFWYDLEDALWETFSFEPEVKEEWTPQQMIDAVLKYYPNAKMPEMADNKYTVFDMDTVIRIFRESFIGWYPYVAETWDCDKYAERFRLHLTEFGNNAGVVVFGMSGWGYHSWKLIPCINGVLVAEPQKSGHADWMPFIKVLPDTIDQNGKWEVWSVRAI